MKATQYFSALILFLLSVSVAFGQDLVLKSVSSHALDVDHEVMFIKALESIRNNDLADAINQLESLVSINPKFKLAQLVYADLLLARSGPISDFGNLSYAPYENIVALRDEAKARWQHHQSSINEERIPASLVKLDDHQEFAIMVDLDEPRLYLFRNEHGMPRLVKDFYASIGKNGFGKYLEGDQKTPVGVYFASGFIEPAELPDLYGNGAFPINYPNAWDRKNGYTGYGIWLHGTPSSTYSRPPRDSDGCVIVSNEDLNTLAKYIEAGKTPVILAKDIDWITTEEWQSRQKNFFSFVEQWRLDWESLDTDSYLRHYSRDYSGLGNDYDSWVEYKHRVNSNKSFIKVDLSETSIFHYPDGMNILVITFSQDYESDNVKRRFKKRQYWKREDDGSWRIFYEGSVS